MLIVDLKRMQVKRTDGSRVSPGTIAMTLLTVPGFIVFGLTIFLVGLIMIAIEGIKQAIRNAIAD